MSGYRIGFVMEQTLGHVTHDRNLRQWAGEDASLQAEWLPVPFDAEDRWQRSPVVRNNWTLRASLRARANVREMLRRGAVDGLFFHTQVTALFAASFMRRIPTVVSLDATPINVDTVGAAYDHARCANPRVEALKNVLNRRTFQLASHLITWCDWAKQSLIWDYGIAPAKVTVIPPGIDLDKWRFDRKPESAGRPVRLLFVGGDFKRKGGEYLLEAFRTGLTGRCELDIVTRDQVDVSDLRGVRVHHGLGSNDPKLLSLYAAADIFVFPTLGDCLPIAVMEAMASGLPVVSTCVGALSEEVEDGRSGLIVPVENSKALTKAVCRLVTDPDLRYAMGQAGRAAAEMRFDGRRNYGAVLAQVKASVNASVKASVTESVKRCVDDGR